MPIDSATTIAEAIDKRSVKASQKRRRTVKCHRPRKESTKTITTRLYSKWSEVVKAKYEHKCAICGEPDSKEHPLNAHHIMPRQNFSGLRFNPMNGIALCPKCHKFGKYSAHKGGVWFAWWLRANALPVLEFCINHADDELDCSNRLSLYSVEMSLHALHEDVIGKPSTFEVYGILADGRDIHSTIHGVHNAKAAETVFAECWKNKGPERLKGITKVEKVQ